MTLGELRAKGLLVGCVLAAACVNPRPPATLPTANQTPTKALLAQLRDPDAARRADAAWALADAHDVDSDGIAALKAALDDESAPVREGATWALYRGTIKVPPGELPWPPYDTKPASVRITRPKYPQDAFVKKIGGTVVLKIMISVDGLVDRAVVTSSVPGLDDAAIACVKEWVFTPAIKNGRAIPMVVTVPVGFRIY